MKALGCLLALMSAANALTYNERVDNFARLRLLQREARNKAYEEWKQNHANLPKRKTKSICDGTGECILQGVQGSLRRHHGLMFCVDCPTAHIEGSYGPCDACYDWKNLHSAVETWDGFHNQQEYHVTGVPNDGSSEILNTIGGTIALVFRGNVPLVEKARHVQAAGADAMVVIDNGDCKEGFECSSWLGSKASNELAEFDAPSVWDDIYVPVVLISQSQGKRLLQLLNTEESEIEELGVQVYVP